MERLITASLVENGEGESEPFYEVEGGQYYGLYLNIKDSVDLNTKRVIYSQTEMLFKNI